METIGFRMKLKPGSEDAYKRRHDEIWPELSDLLRQAGITDYSIFLDPETQHLFAVLKRTDDHGMDDLPSHPLMQRWWKYMADLMDTNADNSPVVHSLEPLFYLP
jgi:L-rhamnose mutarotase